MKYALFFILIFTINLNGQTKKETIEWLQQKLKICSSSGNNTSCFKDEGKGYCYYTKEINFYDMANSGLDVIMEVNHTIYAIRSYDYNKSDSWIFDNIYLTKITKVEIKQDDQFSGNHTITIYFYLPNTTQLREVKFAVNLKFEADLPSRMQKAFDHLCALNRGIEKF